ncbi:hypothetical protein [Archangium lansingense]|uniref:Bacteriocin n=1 Tax=Archangium lansingense TaxID=2995310 RepID=A0ABT4AP22_9BACT|nr:hypothetical protein [Archangium lansinium]MCY1083336.1 hypothetical protein [Archangium lansinium]
MNRKTKKQSQPRKTQQSTRRSQELEKKELTLEDLASVTGGFAEALELVPDASVKLEDRAGNKGEAE